MCEDYEGWGKRGWEQMKAEAQGICVTAKRQRLCRLVPKMGRATGCTGKNCGLLSLPQHQQLTLNSNSAGGGHPLIAETRRRSSRQGILLARAFSGLELSCTPPKAFFLNPQGCRKISVASK